jgi:hypothetical protein
MDCKDTLFGGFLSVFFLCSFFFLRRCGKGDEKTSLCLKTNGLVFYFGGFNDGLNAGITQFFLSLLTNPQKTKNYGHTNDTIKPED